MSVPPPSEAQQLAFLGNIQRLLEEGQFAATYKYALLVALTDIAVERGRDDGVGAARSRSDWIAQEFVEYFWNHTRPYRSAELFQNKNNARNIALIGMLRRAQLGAETLAIARQGAGWQPLVRAVAKQISRMPLFKLQTLRSSGKLIFLYEEKLSDDAIDLLPRGDVLPAALLGFHPFVGAPGVVGRDPPHPEECLPRGRCHESGGVPLRQRAHPAREGP